MDQLPTIYEPRPEPGLELPEPQKRKDIGFAEGWTIILAVIGLVTFFMAENSPTMPGIIFIGCMLSLPVLLANWCVVIRGWWIYPVAMIGSLLAGLLLMIVTSPRSLEPMLLLMPMAITVPVVLTLELVKRLLGEFTRDASRRTDSWEGLQFQISHMFIATTVVAILVAVGQALTPYAKASNDQKVVTLSLIIVTLSINAIVNVWATMGRTVVWRVLVSAVTAVVVSALGFWLAGRFSGLHRIGMLATFMGLSWLSSLIHLLLLRCDGYRFVRR